MSCEHLHTGYMTWPEKSDPELPHAAVNCCDRPACRIRASADVAETTGREGVFVPFAPEVVAKLLRTNVRRGQVWEWEGATITVTRVGAPQWADIRVRQSHGAEWSKRQPLPFPDAWTLKEAVQS